MLAQTWHPNSPAVAPLAWLLNEQQAGRNGALLTITTVNGSAPQPVGTQMAVTSGDRFLGYLSGGCVEPAIAREVEAVIAGRQSRMLKFGKGSPLIDIRFPCGGGIDVLASVGVPSNLLGDALDRWARRQAFSLVFDLKNAGYFLAPHIYPTGWKEGHFYRTYLPLTRLNIAGRGPEFEAVVRVGSALGYELDVSTPDVQSADRLRSLVKTVRHLPAVPEAFCTPMDPWTASVVLFHEREWEDPILAASLAGQPFYIGALGSQRTHTARRTRLLANGYNQATIDRISAPIGIIPQARDPATLALSVLSEIAIKRRELDQQSGTLIHA